MFCLLEIDSRTGFHIVMASGIMHHGWDVKIEHQRLVSSHSRPDQWHDGHRLLNRLYDTADALTKILL